MNKTTQIIKGLAFIFLLNMPLTLISQVGIGLTNPTAQLTVNEDAIFNESGGDQDFRIESDTQANMFFIDASTDRVGINTNVPANQFQIINNGNIGATSLAESTNSGIEGVAISARNSSTTNGYNAIEAITDYLDTAFIPAGVFGLAISSSTPVSASTIGVRGHSNEWQGTGVYGSRFDSGGPDSGWGGQFYDDLGYTGFFGVISDERTKRNIIPINNSLNIINQLNPVQYYFDLDKYPSMGLNEELEYGFIAQEVRAIIPEITRIKSFNTKASVALKQNQLVQNHTEEFVAIDYTRIIPILTKAIQEQQTIIESQNSKIETLENKLQLLENKVNQILENQE